MRIIMFYHSLRSCWNHGNAHFLRGVATELTHRGHEVLVYEPRDGWSVQNLVRDHGAEPLAEFARVFPGLTSVEYDLETLDLDQALDGADLVLVHEWNPPELIARLGEHRARTRRYCLLFHDTHHRAVTAPDSIAAFDLRDYDAVLAFGRILRDLYLERGWAQRAYTWHEAADVRLFRPWPEAAPGAGQGDSDDGEPRGDLVWIGNWGDDERTTELEGLLFEPVRSLALSAAIYGVRYPEAARRLLAHAGIFFGGWLPNHRVPQVFARFRVTAHVPRQPYAHALPGIPTIRVFEALACGIPLISGPWDDCEGLFRPGEDYLIAADGTEMKRSLCAVLADEALARELARRGRERILERHTCGHRVDELLAIHGELTRREPSRSTDGARSARAAERSTSDSMPTARPAYEATGNEVRQ